MLVEIERVISRDYEELKMFCVRLTKHSSYSEDLLQHVILQLYEKKEIKLDKLDCKSIRNYIFRCIITNWFSKTSPFRRKVMRETSLYDELLVDCDYGLIVDDNIIIEHEILDLMELEFTELDWMRRSLFELYLTTKSLKKLSIQTRIPLTSISRYIREGKQQIRTNVLKKLDEDV
jgi:DNA-directed RNA polymerase specialized sigma24 family protein